MNGGANEMHAIREQYRHLTSKKPECMEWWIGGGGLLVNQGQHHPTFHHDHANKRLFTQWRSLKS